MPLESRSGNQVQYFVVEAPCGNRRRQPFADKAATSEGNMVLDPRGSRECWWHLSAVGDVVARTNRANRAFT